MRPAHSSDYKSILSGPTYRSPFTVHRSPFTFPVHRSPIRRTSSLVGPAPLRRSKTAGAPTRSHVPRSRLVTASGGGVEKEPGGIDRIHRHDGLEVTDFPDSPPGTGQGLVIIDRDIGRNGTRSG